MNELGYKIEQFVSQISKTLSMKDLSILIVVTGSSLESLDEYPVPKSSVSLAF